MTDDPKPAAARYSVAEVRLALTKGPAWTSTSATDGALAALRVVEAALAWKSPQVRPGAHMLEWHDAHVDASNALLAALSEWGE